MSVYEATVLGRFGRVPPATWSASQGSNHFPTVRRRSAGAWPSSAARIAALTASDLASSGIECLASRQAAGQSSSGLKVWGATQALQIGVAASRSPRGIGTFRSGYRHSTS